MIRYAEEIQKLLKKGLLPREVFRLFHNAFRSLDLTKDLNLFDIKTLKVRKEAERTYYRIRKGQFRAIFFLEANDIYVIAMGKREEVYKKWQ